jgi:arylsulfatase A
MNKILPKKIFVAVALVTLCLGLMAPQGMAQAAKTDASVYKGSAEETAVATAYRFTPDPKLPNVLLLGDSISIGYTLPARDHLRGVANVYRPMRADGRPENCSGSDWWVNGNFTPTVSTSVPVMAPEDVIAYNAAAVAIMRKHGIAIDDLYAKMLPQQSELQIPANCHFKKEGSKVLGDWVAEAVANAIKAPGILAGVESQLESGQPPNVVMVICDDLGLGDLACYGNPVIKTPNIDKLAADGIRFEQYYCPAPICGPSRVALLTGRYSERSGFRMAHDPKDSSLEEPWLAGQLRGGGYATGAFGKWHVGNMGFRARGFEEWSITSPGGWADYYKYSVFRNSEIRQKSQGVYATDYITDEAVGFIDRHADVSGKKPFFAYVAYTAPHFPLQVPDEEVVPYRGRGLSSGAEIIYGMVARIDKGIGRILEALEKHGVLENTLIVFTSDNGPEFGQYQGLDQRRFNCDLAGQKTYVLEGGIRVPCIVSWPLVLGKSGRIFKATMLGVDWAPTILAAAGIAPSGKTFDGVSFLDALKGKSAAPSPPRFWCYNKAYLTSTSNAAMREGDWKLHRPALGELNRWDNAGRVPKDLQPQPWELYNIANDPLEKSNIASGQPERVNQMLKQFDAWWGDVVKENEQHSGPSHPGK